MEKDRGLYRWFLRQDAFGHGEKRQDYRERLWKEIGEEEETRERKSLFYFILFRLESLVALIGPGVHRLRPN